MPSFTAIALWAYVLAGAAPGSAAHAADSGHVPRAAAVASRDGFAEETVLRLHVAAKTVATMRTLHDYSTLVLTLENFADVTALHAALRTSAADVTHVVAKQVDIRHVQGSEGHDPAAPQSLRVYLHLPVDVVAAKLVHTGSELQVLVTSRSDVAALKERIMQYYVPQISAAGETASLLRAGEDLLLHGKLQDATESFSELLSNYPLRPWAELRLADVALLKRGKKAGCAAYLKAHKNHSARAAGLVAGMHAAVLNCAGAPTTNRREWESLLLRGQADDPASRWLAAEAHWALTWTHDLDLVQQAAAYGPRILDLKTFQILLEKVLLLAPPQALVAFAKANQAAMARHPDAVDLHILHVAALCQLELNRQADAQALAYAAPHADPYLLGAGQCNADGATPSGHSAQADKKLFDSKWAQLVLRLQKVRQASVAQRESP
jgi:hypothetical protein